VSLIVIGLQGPSLVVLGLAEAGAFAPTVACLDDDSLQDSISDAAQLASMSIAAERALLARVSRAARLHCGRYTAKLADEALACS